MSNGLEIPENYTIAEYTDTLGDVIGIRFISPDEKEEIHIFNPTAGFPTGYLRKLRRVVDNSGTEIIEYYLLNGTWTQDSEDVNTYFHIEAT